MLRKNKATRQRRKIRQEKWLLLTSKEDLTEEEKSWLEIEKTRRKRDLKRAENWGKGHLESKRLGAKARRALLTREEKDIINQKSLLRVRKRRKRDPVFASLNIIRARMGNLLREARGKTSPRVKDRFFAYFGCNPETFLSHIESKFSDGMSWENRGKLWHLDHIVPLCAGLGNVDLLMRMNHYRNLQPLTVEENYRKGHSLPRVWPEGVPFTREEVLESVSKSRARKTRQKCVDDSLSGCPSVISSPNA